MLDHPVLRRVATEHSATPPQVALAWVLRQDGVMTIPKGSSLAHVRENRAAYDLNLTEADLAVLDRAFPPPAAHRPLDAG
jgi:diketogulonate reductase-like aldo/keto reductase